VVAVSEAKVEVNVNVMTTSQNQCHTLRLESLATLDDLTMGNSIFLNVCTPHLTTHLPPTHPLVYSDATL
jgi:hypothetical protein